MKHILFTLFILFLLQLSFSQDSKNKKNTYTFEFEEIKLPVESETRAISAISEDIVWASGNEGRVFLTKDGGINWEIFKLPDCDDTEFRSLHAWDSLNAIVFDVSPEGRGFVTEDGGRTWNLV